MKKFLFILWAVTARVSLGAMDPSMEEVMKEVVADSPHDFSQVIKNSKPDLGFYMGLDDAPIDLACALAKPTEQSQEPVSPVEKPPYKFEPIIGNMRYDPREWISLAMIRCERVYKTETEEFHRCVDSSLMLEEFS